MGPTASDGPFLGAGYITTATDASSGCLIAASAAVVEYPIWGQPPVRSGRSG